MSAPTQSTSRREWLNRLALLVFGPLALLTVLEFTLWVFDVAPETASATEVRRAAIVDAGWDPTTYASTLKTRPPNGRVMCFGGSSMAGLPLTHELSMCNLVAEALTPAAETYNSASAALDSQDVRVVMDVACRYEHELMLLYSGHNEFLNLKYFAGGKPNETALAAAEYLSGFRFFRLLQRALASERPTAGTVGVPEVDNAEVYARYEANLRHIFEACKGRKLVVSTVVSNRALKNPRGDTLRNSHRRGALKPVPSHDTCRECFRAADIVNLTIRRLADEYGVPVVDANSVLGTDDPHSLFWDHVHPRPELHRRLAAAFLKTAKSAGYIEDYRAPNVRIAPEKVRRAAADRALFNLQFDPALARRQIRNTAGYYGTAVEQLGIALASFVLDDTDGLKTALAAASQAVHDSPETARRLSACTVGQDDCFPVRRELMMNESERDELVQIAVGEQVHPALLSLLRRF